MRETHVHVTDQVAQPWTLCLPSRRQTPLAISIGNNPSRLRHVRHKLQIFLTHIAERLIVFMLNVFEST
jgi:hypothetical protein